MATYWPVYMVLVFSSTHVVPTAPILPGVFPGKEVSMAQTMAMLNQLKQNRTNRIGTKELISALRKQ